MKDKQKKLASCNKEKSQDIAIVGMSFRFPGASTKEQFWENLINKVSSIQEIPESRWDWKKHYDPAPKKDDQKTISKWGGFIENIDRFDAAFFSVSPKEAESMDPQQRLSMEVAWECFEDAGLAPSAYKNTKTGVYLGCSNADYPEVAAGSHIEAHYMTGMSMGVVANRISQYFNFQGPSEVTDTACSSSLVTIHKAMNDFKTGDITAALVGGVNLILTESRYISFSKLGVMSPLGRCKTLDADADGYVRSEGLGMLLLLPLETALQENATIYGVIKGSSVGHSGKTNTLTAPNPFSQSRVIQEAHKAAGIHSNQVSYVEIHGTGTRLGDPIEIQGLKRAFRATKSDAIDPESTCYLSTVKTNIGHLEPAAGVAGVIKVLLSFTNNQIPPLQNFNQLNPKISLAKSPFKLATAPTDWPGNELEGWDTRIAGVSSFGFAGVNAHVILEERPKQLTVTPESTPLNSHCLIILSAKNEKALQQRALQLLAYLEREQFKSQDLNNLAYTLQVGREPMDYRFGFIAASVVEVKEQLQLFTQNKPGLWQHGKQGVGQEPTLDSNQAMNLAELLSSWVSGSSVDWNLLYNGDGAKPKRISLPTYPFARNRYWITHPNSEDKPLLNNPVLHPLLHETLPSFDELVFVSRFNGGEFFLKDHIVQQQRVLPGVCILEMVREAMSISHHIDDEHSVVFDKVNWFRPIVVDKEQAVYLSLWEENASITFELWSLEECTHVNHAQGQVALSKQAKSVENLSLREGHELEELKSEQVYSLFANAGLNYGPSFQGIQKIQRHAKESLAQVRIEKAFSDGFGFSPALLDAALQSLVVFAKEGEVALPFAVERVEFLSTMPEEVWVSARQISSDADIVQKFDLDICDSQGKVCVRFKSFSTRALSRKTNPTIDNQAKPSVLSANPNPTVLNNNHEIADAPIEKLFTLKPGWITTVAPDTQEIDLLSLVAAYKGPQALKPAWFVAKEEQSPATEHLVWIADGEHAEPLTLFRYIKSLLADGYGAKPFTFTLITLQTQRVYKENTSAQGAGLIGLTQSLAQEYPRWGVRIVDMQRDTVVSGQGIPWKDIIALSPGFYAWRANEWHTFEIASHQYQSIAQSPYRENGVYLVLGGAGGLGQVWSEWMIRHYNAQLIWIGRREENTEIQNALARLGSIGKTPLYYSLDAGDAGAMQDALSQIRETFPLINGVIHSILHLEDQSLTQMADEQFLRSYSAKQQTGNVLLELFKGDDLDFLLFFSSLQSFSPASGQGNYAAGCHYLDSLALSYQDQLPIKVINWGYWGSVGIVRDDFYQKRMQQLGIGSIEIEEGMQALKQLLSASLAQAGVVKMQKSQLDLAVKQESFSTEEAISPLEVSVSAIAYAGQEALPTEEILSTLCKALHRAGWHIPEQREQALAALPDYFRSWWEETADYLKSANRLKDGVLAVMSEECSFAKPGIDVTGDGQEQTLLGVCLEQLPLILSGVKQATDILFPNGSLHLVEAVYQNNALADYANEVQVEQLQAYLKAMKLSSVRILEIGAGIGGTTASVLPGLQAWNIEEYAYTDLSRVFFNHAKEHFQKDYPFIETKYFDVSKPLEPQKIDLAAYDVVIATNVLHATSKIRETLQNAKACLKPGGILLINEVVQKSLFTQLTFGLLEGWWLSQDKTLRIPGSPMLSLDAWKRVLCEEGYSSVYAPAHAASPQQILVAQSNGQILQAAHDTEVRRKKTFSQADSKTRQRTEGTANVAATKNEATVLAFVQQTLLDVSSQTLGLAKDELDAESSFAVYGMDSILAVQMLNDINEQLDLALPTTLLFDYPSIATLSEHIATEYSQHLKQFTPKAEVLITEQLKKEKSTDFTVKSQGFQQLTQTKKVFRKKPNKQKGAHVAPDANVDSDPKIAIVGMSGQFGAASDLDEFWSMIKNKETSVAEQQRWDLSALTEKEQIWCRYASLLDDIASFDPAFFSITPQEAMYMDPQQRLFLQECWRALEDANMSTQVAGKNVGVYAGCTQGDYVSLVPDDAPAQMLWGNAGSIIPTRASYFLNLKGPAIAVDTSCSSSLVAMHMAYQALAKKEISCALVGGVTTLCTSQLSKRAGNAGMLSPDGACYTFDDRANGFVPGEGVGVLVLKRLEDAERDQDQIYGVILGSAINQDGATSGITAPSSLSQEQLHREVYDRFNISADSIQMVETHGTGTKLGDPIEFQALTRAFRKDTEENEFCALGSVKTNIGHCLTAAGVAGVIKTLLAMKHQSIPASLHFEKGNSHIQWKGSPFVVSQETKAWNVAADQRRRAAVSSFGFSGTNAHIVLEEYPVQQYASPTSEQIAQPSIITLSAKTPDALFEKVQQLQNWMKTQCPSEDDRLSIAYTLQVGREEMDYRMGFIASSLEEIQEQLKRFANKERGNWKQGEVKHGKDILSALDESDFAGWIEQKALHKLLSFWVIGAKIDWNLLYGTDKPQKIRLPTYPFAKESFWVPTAKVVTRSKTTAIEVAPVNRTLTQTEGNNTEILFPKAGGDSVQEDEAQMFHYTPTWTSESSPEIAPLNHRRRIVLSIGDFGLKNAAVLQSSKDNIADQLEDYAIQLLDRMRGFEDQKDDSLVQLVMQDSSSLFLALSGLLKTAALEYSYLATQLILVDSQHNLPARLEQEAGYIQDQVIRYQGGRREVLSFVEQLPEINPFLPWRENGVYVITGGLGQLGQVFAQEIISKTASATIILVGRKPFSEAIRQQLEELCPAGMRLDYEAADISSIASATLLLEKIVAKHGSLSGIIHSAGVIKDQLISNKTTEELHQVFAPKVAGVIALDEASKAMDLDFFLCFSSIASVFGNIGQVDYATANAFLDQYMVCRQNLVEQSERQGKSISINWPFWEKGGMQVDDLTQAMLQARGITPLPNKQGVQAFYQAFSHAQNCFLYGNREKLNALWAQHHYEPNQVSNKSAVSSTEMMAYIKQVISDITMIAPTDLSEEIAFKAMGLDSIMSIAIVQRLQQDFGELPPALLFEVKTIAELHGYLLNHHAMVIKPEQESARSLLVENRPAGIDVLNYADGQLAPLALSKAQEGLWFLHKQFPAMNCYNVPLVFEVGDYNHRHMQEALDWLCQRHPVLRVTMQEVEGRPQQKIQQTGPYIDEISIGAAPKTEFAAKIRDDIHQPFSLNKQLLWRATCWHVNQDKQPLNLMVIVFHHLIIDGVSASLILEQLWNAYKKRQSNEELIAPAIDLGFFSYLEWERSMLSNQTGQKLQGYWKNELQGELPVIQLPGRKGNPQRVGERISVPIEENMQRRLTRYFEKNNVNAAAFFLSVFQLLLSRYTGKQDLILGVPALHRPKQEMADSLGLFVNQLPLRNIVDTTKDFTTLLNSNQSKLLGLINHSGYPFSEIVRAINAPRTHAYHPIFQIGYAYHNFIQQDWFHSNQDLVESVWDEFQQEPELDLSLAVTPLPDQYRLVLKYDASVYEKGMVEQLSRSYLALLEEILFSGNVPISAYQLFSEEVDTPLSVIPSENRACEETTVVNLFEVQARKTPNHVALAFGGQELSYAELNQQANVFAHHLLAQGVREEALIGLCVKPSIELIIAILGILKAGAAYVPIDPNSPQKRMRFILEDANPSILLLQSGSTFDTKAGTTQVIYLDTWLAAYFDQHRQSSPVVANINKAQPTNLAYVIYTSGSTGKPKGVLVEHRNVAQLFQNTTALFNFSERDTWCLFHSYAFDFSVWEIWGALLHGGKLVIPDGLTRKDSAGFSQFIADHSVTVLNQTPSAFFPLMDILLNNPERAQSLRTIIFGGEALELARLKPWFASNHTLPDLINMYGITETTVHVTALNVSKTLVLNHQDKSLIGKPLPGYSIHLLDEQKAPVQKGDIGEIFVGGAGVARGYFKRRELTGERFITDPQDSDARLYRSGDLGRLSLDGSIEYVGRADDQVQIRGHRVEPGEIKQVLLSLNNIVDASVLSVEKQNGKVLVAYLIAPIAIPVETLRVDLQDRLPEYMIPSFFVFIEAFPLTVNGKIDKDALLRLPLSSSGVSYSDTLFKPTALPSRLASAVELEQSITDIWKQVLEIDYIGIDNPFFEAGGTSILANVLSAKIESQLGFKFPIALIFQYSTIRGMAEYLRSQGDSVLLEQPKAAVTTEANQEITNKPDNVNPDYYESSLAIIGVSCHYPESKDHQAFWENLIQGKDLVKRVSDTNGNEQITWLDSWIEGQDTFDPDFFKISEKNARSMSFSQRQLLLHSWKAIEDAGYSCDQIPKAGVYISASGADTPNLGLHDKIRDSQFVLNAEDYVASMLNQPGTLPTMISYHLGLNGPSLFVHSNCSSSLSAVALACQALKAKEIDYAIVGAACFYPQRYTGYQYEKGLNFASDARCKVFDEQADGMVGGNGVSVIVLKRAEDAVQDVDHIYSLIRGVNINNDGKDKAGFFAPGTKGQMGVIQQALQNAKVNPETISYVEAHGTGTSLGDPIEFASLQQVYQQYTANKQFCGLGGVKSNLGHTDTLAGLTGLLKTSLSLHHKKLPASLHYSEPNPQINLENSPFYIVQKGKEWETDYLPRRAAVSSFGIGGTNAHAILEEYQHQPYASCLLQRPSIIVLSASKQQVLEQQVRELASYLDETSLQEQQRVSLAYTLQTGRKAMQHRIGFVVSSLTELKQKLDTYSGISTDAEKQTVLESGKGEQPGEQEYLTACLIQHKYAEILEHWIQTGFTDWDFLYQGEKVPKISLPTYPFALKKYGLAHAQPLSTSTPVDPVKQEGKLQLLSPVWRAKTPAQEAQNGDRQYVVFCEVPEVKIEDVTTTSLFSSGFSLEQKVENYGYQLLEILKGIAQSKQRTTLQLVLREGKQPNIWLCFHSLLKTASLECPTLKTQLILLDRIADIPAVLNENLLSTQDQVIRYQDDMREVLEYQEIASPKAEMPWKEDGVYLITGGFGGICSHLIEDINRQPFHKTIIATGRKPANHPQVQQQLVALRNDKATLKYYQADVSNKANVIRLIRDVLNEFRTLTGVIHAAGVLQDKLFVNKDQDSFTQVLAPKVRGVIALDEATQDLPLDFFICFGGLSGVHGAYTQIDYALANAFLDNYMHYRESLVLNAERSGKSCSIDWPYWQHGGMQINPKFENAMSQYGISPMPTATGIAAFYQSLQRPQTLVVYELEQHSPVNVLLTNSKSNSASVLPQFESSEALEEHLVDNLLTIAASLLGVNKGDIDPDTDLGDFGADSIAFVSFINQLNEQYQLKLAPSLLFKHSTINSIVGYLLEEHEAALNAHVVVEESATTHQTSSQEKSTESSREDRIAIIGISAEFPEAKNLNEFWENLAHAKDCVTQRAWSGENTQDLPDELQWLGSLARADNFDPLFFNISPSDSSRIYLQESLLMMHVWKCIEDAGYDPASLAGSNTGIFVGCQSSYHDGMIASPAFAPNRMSYFLDLHGPSEGVDTTCSSSLVAIHKACQAIQQGDCDQAIVGGVNIIDSPHTSVALHEIGALSPNGRCKTFSADADGFVRGEGIGMIFIKKLSACKKDNDEIYGTILGSALNHGGKSQGFTVPNSNAQSMLLEKAWQTAGIDPATLSYIECHGTGTSLGDPVEVDALKDAFKRTTKQYAQEAGCALGSVKSNIGHLEIAAGIAGVIKVLLQFKHKTLVPSLHVNALNPYLALENTPFNIQTKKQAWECAGKRRAAVSSFGISGVNSHVVLEEADSASQPKANEAGTTSPSIVLLSASTEASLTAKLQDLHAYLERGDYTEQDRVRLAYTLQVGRSHFKYRMAWLVSSIEELKGKLALCIKKADAGELQGMSKVGRGNNDAIPDDEFVHLVDTHNHDAIIRFWLDGKKINWHAQYAWAPQKMHLPTYPFTKKQTSVNKRANLIALPTGKGASRAQTALANGATQEQWLVLNTSWKSRELTYPQDWKSNIESVLQAQRILLISQTIDEQASLLGLLDEAWEDSKPFHIESMLFDQMSMWSFDNVSAPDIVLYLGSQDRVDSINNVSTQVKCLFEFIQSIEELEEQAIQLFYASFIDEDALPREDITALLRSYSLRNPQHQWSMVEFVSDLGSTGSLDQINWEEKLLQEVVAPKLASPAGEEPNHIQYKQQQRLGIQLQRTQLPESFIVEGQTSYFRKNGVYLIVGALGELGKQLSQCLLEQYDAKLILLGRRSVEESQEVLTELFKLQGSVHYFSCDVSIESDLREVAQFLDQENMALNGIFHLGTSFSQEEACWDDFERSMQVKVEGSLLLDTVFEASELDFFILFSSMAVFGTLNHLSYSYGNGFQNYFSSYRNSLVTQKQRCGKTLALNWGYWHSDGPIKRIENSFAEKKGYTLIRMDEAFPLLESLLASDKGTLGVILSHDKDKIYQNTSRLLVRKGVANKKFITKQAELVRPDATSLLTTEQLSVANTVINIVSNVIGITPDELDLECDLYEYGFDSISLLKTFQQLQQQLSIDIQADAFRSMDTIQSLIDDIENLSRQSQGIQNGDQYDESQEDVTPAFIHEAGISLPVPTSKLEKAYEGDIKSVFLTGATGFLGGHTLQQLLTTTEATIYCLVRAKTIQEAQERILRNSSLYQLDIDMRRVVPILGDVEQVQLGMSEENWRLLCQKVQHIVHTAAYVNHIQPYFAFRKSVSGTSELLVLAYTNTIKMIHFVSSTTVSTQVKSSHFSVNPVENFIDAEKAKLLVSGYGQSKWVQEENIRIASLAGVPYTIYRFSEISGSSQTGIGNTNDVFHRILRMMLSVSVRLEDAQYLLDVIPVDIAASTIVLGMNDPKKRNTVFNVANPTPLSMAEFYHYAADHGMSFETDSKETFIAACREYASRISLDDDRVIMEGLLTSRPGYDEYLFETYFTPLTPYHKNNFLNLMATYGIDFIAWEELFNTYFKQWKEDRYFQSLWAGLEDKV